jgi:uncharacterized phiE125 gp8 family phage protein
MRYRETSQVVTEPITLDEAREHLRLDPYGSPPVHPDDDYVTALITAARTWTEEYLRRALATKTIEIVYDSFYDIDLALPLAPVQSVTSVEYIDRDGATQTLATTVYGVDTFANKLYLKYNQQWPEIQDTVNPVIVTAVVGYTNGESPDTYPFPAPIKSALNLIIANLYENRQQDQVGTTRISFNSLPMGVYSLLQPYRLGLGM